MKYLITLFTVLAVSSLGFITAPKVNQMSARTLLAAVKNSTANSTNSSTTSSRNAGVTSGSSTTGSTMGTNTTDNLDATTNTNANLDTKINEIVGISRVGTNLPLGSSSISEGRITSIDRIGKRVSVRDSRTGSIVAYTINDTSMFEDLKQGDNVQVFKGPSSILK